LSLRSLAIECLLSLEESAAAPRCPSGSHRGSQRTVTAPLRAGGERGHQAALAREAELRHMRDDLAQSAHYRTHTEMPRLWTFSIERNITRDPPGA
jgi:hypothetical protein